MRRRLLVAPAFVLLLVGLALAYGSQRAVATDEYSLDCAYGQGCYASGVVSQGSVIITITGYNGNGEVVKHTTGGSCSDSSGCQIQYQAPGYSNIAWSYLELTTDGYGEFTYITCTGQPAPPPSSATKASASSAPRPLPKLTLIPR